MKHTWIFVNFSMMNTENLTDECFQQCTPSGRFFTEVKNQNKLTFYLLSINKGAALYSSTIVA
jgi:hypothetical protein